MYETFPTDFSLLRTVLYMRTALTINIVLNNISVSYIFFSLINIVHHNNSSTLWNMRAKDS